MFNIYITILYNMIVSGTNTRDSCFVIYLK